MRDATLPSGMTAKEIHMTNLALSHAPATSRSGTLAFVAALFLGAGLIVFAGHVQASALHDAAHDTRHATGFPCH